MRRFASFGILLVLTLCFVLPSQADARGKGWKDFLIGTGMGTAFGATAGGATTLFLEPQKYQDAIFPVHYMVGAGIGLIVGATGGAVVGWLPSKEEDYDKAETAGFIGHTGMFYWEMPMVSITPVQVNHDKVEDAFFIHPVRLRF